MLRSALHHSKFRRPHQSQEASDHSRLVAERAQRRLEVLLGEAQEAVSGWEKAEDGVELLEGKLAAAAETIALLQARAAANDCALAASRAVLSLQSRLPSAGGGAEEQQEEQKEEAEERQVVPSPGGEARWLGSRVAQLEGELATLCEWVEDVQRVAGHNPYRSPYRSRPVAGHIASSARAQSSSLSDGGSP
jgi:hypothetical protein